MGRLAAWLSDLKHAFSRAHVNPRVVMLLRHGEKTGKKNDIHLNARGNGRANALPALFSRRFPVPDFIFATKATANSNRPVETVKPLAKALGLPVRQQFANDQFSGLAHELLSNPAYAGKAVLICWHRGKIPALAVNLGVKEPLPTWTDQQFDRVWRIEYTANGVSFANLPQRLLAGDSET